jgi:hypothetical protein
MVNNHKIMQKSETESKNRFKQIGISNTANEVVLIPSADSSFHLLLQSQPLCANAVQVSMALPQFSIQSIEFCLNRSPVKL